MGIIICSLLWLATASVSGSKTYYVTIPELFKMGNEASVKRVRVGGDVQKDSIVRGTGVVRFTLVQDKLTLPVVYEGRDPLPDTFKDGAQALAGGRLDSAGVFHAQEVQAKCASKYAPKPGVAPDGLQKKILPASSSYKS
ncbi:MAG TPA: cytochrome c maturation protein CcmE [Bryobacteraceae bacterium]|nr:cytochrome c maturation protein CcmE [Bryobacteraceae bacterium]